MHLHRALTLKIILTFLGVLAGINASAGDYTFTRYHHETLNWDGNITFGGSVDEKTSFFVQHDPLSDERVWNNVNLRLFLDVLWNKHVRTYGKMKLNAFLPQSEYDVRVLPEEAYLDLYMGPVDVRAGYQIFAWGSADLINPTDRLNPRDFTDILDAPKEGILALKAAVAFAPNWSLEGIWIPLPQESILPPPGSRFFVPPISDPTLTQLLVDLRPSRNLKNPQFGARIKGSAGRFDLAFSYSYSLVTVPQEEVVVQPFDPVMGTVTVDVTKVFPREHVLGANLATTIKGLSLHLETAATFPRDTGRNIGSADQFRFNYAVGGNYSFNNVIGDQDIRFYLDFTQEIHRGAKSSNLTRIFQLAVLTRLEYLFSDDLSLSVDAAINLNDRDYLIRPKLSWGFYEGFRLTAGFDIINGPGGSFLNQFSEDDRGYLALSYQF